VGDILAPSAKSKFQNFGKSLMQYSTNSNAAILGEIRSACTPIGQYRKAALIAKDKEHTLEVYRLEHQKQLLEIKKLEWQAVALETGGAIGKIEAAQLRIDADLLKLQMAQAEPLLEDAVRELWVAKTEMERLCDDAGIQFGEIPSQEFQELMADEYRDRQLRHQLAGIYAAQVGMPVDRMEALLELPQDELLAIAQRLQPLLKQNPILMMEAAANAN
jgi:hypothetical protein